MDENTITITLDPATINYLRLLADTGLYGSTDDPSVVAIALIDEGIRRAVERGLVGPVQQGFYKK